MEYLLCCRTSSSAARRKTDELPDQEVNLLKTNESDDFSEEVSEDESQDETGDRREHSLAEVHCGPSALECGKDAIALMEKISTAEAIVAQELARMQNKAGDNLSSSTTEYTKVGSSFVARDAVLEGRAGGDSKAESGAMIRASALSSAAAAAAGDRISIASREEITEKEVVAEEILHGAAATAATAVETTTFTAGINEIPTPTITAPASSLQSKQYTGTIEQEVVGEGAMTIKEVDEEERLRTSPGCMGDTVTTLSSEESKLKSTPKREFSTSILNTDESTESLTSEPEKTPQKDGSNHSIETTPSEVSPTNPKSLPSDLSLRCSKSFDEACEQLADYFEMRGQATNQSCESSTSGRHEGENDSVNQQGEISLESMSEKERGKDKEETIIDDGVMNLADINETNLRHFLPEIVFPCLEEMPAASAVGEATPIFIKNEVIETVLDGACEIVQRGHDDRP